MQGFKDQKSTAAVDATFEATCDITLSGHSEGFNALAVLPDGRLASGSFDKVIMLWDLKRGEREDIPKDCPPKLASLIKFCWDGDQAKRPTAARIVEFLRSDEKEFTSASNISGSATAAADTASTAASPSYQSNLNSQSFNSAAVSYQGNLNSPPPVTLSKK